MACNQPFGAGGGGRKENTEEYDTCSKEKLEFTKFGLSFRFHKSAYRDCMVS